MAKKTVPATTKDKAFALGDKGVNIVSTPLHAEPGELQSAQNVIFSPDRAKHGLVKRPGMTKFNAEAAGGTILAMQSVPLPVPEEAASDRAATTMDGLALFVFGAEAAPAGQTQSVDGAVWTQPAGTVQDGCSNYWKDHCLHKTGGILIAPKNKAVGANIIFQTYDGTTWADAFTMADRVIGAGTYTPRILKATDQDDDNFYVIAAYALTAGSGTNHDAVVKVNKTTYAETYLGETFCASSPFTGGIVYSVITGLAVFGGNIFVQGYTSVTPPGLYNAAKVWMITPTGTAWTLDMSLGGAGTSSSYTPRRICGHGAQLWASWSKHAAYATAAVFRVRDGEVWTTLVSGVAGGFGYYDPVFATGDEMWAWKTPDPAGVGLELWYTDDRGATLTQIATVADDLDVLTRAFRWELDDKLYCAIGDAATAFEVWEITVPANVFDNAGTVQAGYGLMGAAIAPPPAPLPDWSLPDPVPADPVLPTAPTSVMAKASVYLATTASVPGYQERPVFFDTATFNVGTMWILGTSALTVPYGGAGYYLVTTQVAWNNNAGTRELRANLCLNGTVVARGRSGFNWSPSSEYVFVRATTLIKVSDGDKLEVRVSQRGGTGGINFNMIGGISHTFLQAIRLL